GLVVRRTDPADRRRAWLEATAGGKRLVERNRRQRDAYLATVLRGLPPEDLAALERGVAVLEHLLETSP
ncbi:MAG: MarR family transcriptional regulator, partial [Candidatus Dormibacteraeota bacterium]|nr:MarR family transcriptional regulator [Candidatus Dormibacteraeota bacterium]